MLRHVGIFLFALVFFGSGFAPVPRESYDALGATKGKPITKGFVFIDGKYIEPPYIVERWGAGIRINRQPVMNSAGIWEKLLKTQPESNLIEEGEGDAETASTVESVDAASHRVAKNENKPVDAGQPSEARQPKAAHCVVKNEKPIIVIAEMRYGASGDSSAVDPSAEAMEDLFGDEPLKPEKNAEKKEENSDAKVDAVAHRVDKKEDSTSDGRGEASASTKKDESAKDDAKKEDADAKVDAVAHRVDKKEDSTSDGRGEASASTKKEDPASTKKRGSLALKGKFIKNDASTKIVRQLNSQRTRYDKILRKGGAIFFGSGYRAFWIDDERTAETMIVTLASTQKKQTEFEDFANEVSVYFHRQLAEDLFKHRIDYRQLQERLSSINQERKIQNLLNK